MKLYENRHNGLDLLRILSAVSVIIIHINAHYLSGNTKIYSGVYFCEVLLDTITRFAVPCFVMMSGAFLLENTKNQNLSYFYRNSVFKIFCPFFIVAVFLLIESEIKQIFTSHNYAVPLKDMMNGTFYNLWFMYMLFFLYLMVPFVVKLKEKCSEKLFGILGIVLLVWGSVSQAVSKDTIAYSNGLCFSFLGYFIIGSVILNRAKDVRITFRERIIEGLMIAGLPAVTVVFRYNGIAQCFFSSYAIYFLPAIILYSMAIFNFFAGINIQISVKGASDLTFYVYLFHSVIYGFLFKVLAGILVFGDMINIAVVSLLTICLSFAVAKCFSIIWKSSVNKIHLYERWCQLPLWKKLESYDV